MLTFLPTSFSIFSKYSLIVSTPLLLSKKILKCNFDLEDWASFPSSMTHISANSVDVCFRKLISACPSETSLSNGPSKSKTSTCKIDGGSYIASNSNISAY
ncbi:hypothetical protein AAZV13_19G072900 [Glycine max]